MNPVRRFAREYGAGLLVLFLVALICLCVLVAIVFYAFVSAQTVLEIILWTTYTSKTSPISL